MRKLRKYCVGGSFYLLFVFIGLLICNILGFVAILKLWESILCYSIEEIEDIMLFYAMAAFAFGCWLFIIVLNIDRFYFADARRFKKNIKRVKKQGKYKELIEDFQNGERMFSGGLIVGNTFLICKGNAMIISYDDEGYLMRTRVRKRDVRTNHTSNAEF